MGSRDGSIVFNSDRTYRLELKFKGESLIQAGKWAVSGDILTLTPSKGAPITLKLTWKDANHVSAVATRPGRKMTEFYFYRSFAG